jgi:hypothetical protein
MIIATRSEINSANAHDVRASSGRELFSTLNFPREIRSSESRSRRRFDRPAIKIPTEGKRKVLQGHVAGCAGSTPITSPPPRVVNWNLESGAGSKRAARAAPTARDQTSNTAAAVRGLFAARGLDVRGRQGGTTVTLPGKADNKRNGIINGCGRGQSSETILAVWILRARTLALGASLTVPCPPPPPPPPPPRCNTAALVKPKISIEQGH